MQLEPFQLERYFAEYEFHVDYVLCGSDCESVSIQDLLNLEPDSRRRFHEQRLGYTESMGAPGLRAEIARIYETMTPDNILVHTGAEEAIFLFMHAALTADDHVVVHTPCYQSLAEVARSIGCDMTPWTARADKKWQLDPEKLQRLIRPNTRAVVINTPHNPTGYLMSKAVFAEIGRITADRGILLFSDEVYRELEYRQEDRLPAACDLHPGAVSLGVMSKTYGLPGLRIGWIATARGDILEKMAVLKDYTTICNSAPSEFLAELALRHREVLAQRNLDIIRDNLDRLDNFFASQAAHFAWQRPIAGPIAFPRLQNGNVETFCERLVKTAGVLLLPGTLYGDTGNHFRIGFGRKNMPDALARLKECMEKLPAATG